jgi:quercetin dioxygenase-like cupin family protein
MHGTRIRARKASADVGQTVVVTAGSGWVQQWGGRIEAVRSGDVVRIPPGRLAVRATSPGFRVLVPLYSFAKEQHASRPLISSAYSQRRQRRSGMGSAPPPG